MSNISVRVVAYIHISYDLRVIYIYIGIEGNRKEDLPSLKEMHNLTCPLSYITRNCIKKLQHVQSRLLTIFHLYSVYFVISEDGTAVFVNLGQ